MSSLPQTDRRNHSTEYPAVAAPKGERQRRRRPRRGAKGVSLITTLVTIAVTSVMAAGIAVLVTGHAASARADQDSARALDLAECGLNFQLQRIFATVDKTQVAYDGNVANVNTATYGLKATPLPVISKTYNGTTSTLNTFLNVTGTGDYCRAWIEYPGNATKTLDLTSGADLYIYGEAQVNGVKCTVRAKAGANALFDRWALFGNDTVQTGGNLSVTPTSGSTLGYIGSNNLIDIAKPDNIGGQVIYGTGTPSSNMPYVYGGRPVEMPSIDELANEEYASGGYPTNNLGTNTGIAKFSVNNDNSLGLATKGNGNFNANLPANGNLTNGTGSYPIKLVGKTTGANYYLTRLDGSGATIYADVRPATGSTIPRPINLWVNSTSSGDQLQGNINIVAYLSVDASGNPIPSLDASKYFHIYYNNPNGDLTITGGGSTQNIYAMIYAYNLRSDGTPYGNVNVAGTVTINGAVYANTITGKGSGGGGGGSFVVNYPTNVSLSDDAGIYFGLRTPWQEYNTVRGL